LLLLEGTKIAAEHECTDSLFTCFPEKSCRTQTGAATSKFEVSHAFNSKVGRWIENKAPLLKRQNIVPEVSSNDSADTDSFSTRMLCESTALHCRRKEKAGEIASELEGDIFDEGGVHIAIDLLVWNQIPFLGSVDAEMNASRCLSAPSSYSNANSWIGSDTIRSVAKIPLVVVRAAFDAFVTNSIGRRSTRAWACESFELPGRTTTNKPTDGSSHASTYTTAADDDDSAPFCAVEGAYPSDARSKKLFILNAASRTQLVPITAFERSELLHLNIDTDPDLSIVRAHF
jgi:hypothetical protein